MKTEEDYSPLHYACFKGSFDVASFIISLELNNESELNYFPSNTMNTPIYLAVLSRSSRILELLFQSGAKMSSQPDYINNTITESLKKGDMASFSILTSHIDSVKNTYTGLSLIMKAIQFRLPKAIPTLIKLGDDVSYMTKEGKSALFLACFLKNEEIVKILLENGAKTNEKGFIGQYPIHWAATSGNVNIVKMILSHGGDPKVTDDRGRLPTFSALVSPKNKDEIIKILLDAGCDPNLPDKLTNTILSTIVTMEPTKEVLNTIKIILDKGGDINHVCRNNKTIYQMAQLGLDPKILNVLDEFAQNHPK